jgi:hypothetical protein
MLALALFLSVAFAQIDFVPNEAEIEKIQAQAGYTLTDNFVPNNFFNNFNFDTENDPTHGYVNYVDESTAQSKGYIKNDTTVYIGCDYKNVASGRGRDSVRITSKKSWNSGTLIVQSIEVNFLGYGAV